MKPIIISIPGVIKLLKHLKPHKASEPENIPTRLLIMVAEEIAPMLTTIFQTSLDTATVPSYWREALITPLYKKGPSNIPANYRPVSLTSVESKMLEHIIFSSTMKHLNSHKILTPSQQGFRSKRSCETRLIVTIQGIAKYLKTGKDQVDVILLDFAKAFDKVPFQRLLLKSSFYGLRDNTLQWISSFLHGRTQQVLVEGCTLEKLDVLSGVPQGTVVGPLLFLIYINDLPTVCKSSKANLFPEDTLLYRHIANDGDSTKLQEDLLGIQVADGFPPGEVYSAENHNQQAIPQGDQLLYFLYGQHLQVADSAQYLGVTSSDDLQWEKHTQATAAKASHTLEFLRRNLKDCSKQVRSTTYKSMVCPTMEYASSSWDPYKTEDADYLDKVQRHAARYACHSSR